MRLLNARRIKAWSDKCDIAKKPQLAAIFAGDADDFCTLALRRNDGTQNVFAISTSRNGQKDIAGTYMRAHLAFKDFLGWVVIDQRGERAGIGSQRVHVERIALEQIAADEFRRPMLCICCTTAVAGKVHPTFTTKCIDGEIGSLLHYGDELIAEGLVGLLRLLKALAQNGVGAGRHGSRFYQSSGDWPAGTFGF